MNESPEHYANILRATAVLIVEQAREIAALKALLSPPALFPIAPIPERHVTGIDVDSDKE